MPRILISLVGEQPAPNVLPLQHYQPEHVVLVHTKRTSKLAERIASVVGQGVIRPFCETDAYRVDIIEAQLEKYLEERELGETELVFNLTGGTKTMEFAALEVARQRKAAAFYYQTEDNQSLIHPYHFDENGEFCCDEPVSIQAALTIDQFLRLQAGTYTPGIFRHPFEEKVAAVLADLGAEYEFMPNVHLGPNVEIDWILRFRNTIGVGEVKLHATKSEGIDQLNAVTEQRRLGTYTKRFLISADDLHVNDKALADAYRITTVILPGGREPRLSKEDSARLEQAVREAMEPKQTGSTG